MRRRLFWKILFAFWLTFFAITQGLWLLLEMRNMPSGETITARRVGPVVLAWGAEAVSDTGPEGFRSLLAALPKDERSQLVLEPLPISARPARKPEWERTLTREASAPDGKRYRLSYRYGSLPNPRPLFRTPPEFVALGLLGGFLFSALLAWYITQPITRLRTGFDRLAHGDLETRLSASIGNRRDEIADLGRDFDLMAQRLQQLVSARDRLLHDVSHELRSPLARLQLAIGLVRQDPSRMDVSLERIERETERLDVLVGELLALARAENGSDDERDYFDLAGLVDSVAEDARFEAQSSGIAIDLSHNVPPEQERPLLRGDAELVRRAFDNVIRNALRFSSSGQTIGLAVSYDGRQHSYCVEISDQGPGVPPEDIAAIFDPFIRGEKGGSGLGLGLSIASRAIIAHGGTIVARNLPQGGLAIAMDFPAPPGPRALKEGNGAA